MNNAGYDTKSLVQYPMLGFTNYKKDENTSQMCCLMAFFTEFNSETVKVSYDCSEDERKLDFQIKHYTLIL